MSSSRPCLWINTASACMLPTAGPDTCDKETPAWQGGIGTQHRQSHTPNTPGCNNKKHLHALSTLQEAPHHAYPKQQAQCFLLVHCLADKLGCTVMHMRGRADACARTHCHPPNSKAETAALLHASAGCLVLSSVTAQPSMLLYINPAVFWEPTKNG